MEVINVSNLGDWHIVITFVINPTLSLAYHRQITFHRHRQSPASVISIDRPPPLDMAIPCCLYIGINPISNSLDSQWPLFHLPIYISLTPRYASKDTCPKTASTHAPQIWSIKSLMLQNSLHIHLNTLGFHGYGEEISQNCPCSLYPINTSLALFLHLVILHPQTHLPGSGVVRETQELQQGPPPTILWALDLFLLSGRNGYQLRRPWGQFSITFLLFTVLLIFCMVIYLVFSLFLFLVFPTFKPFRNWSRKLSFQPINPTFNALAHWGNPDPTDLINVETNRIPFRAENFSLDLWKDTFRYWPSSTKGWKDWFLRIGNSNAVQWGERKLD